MTTHSERSGLGIVVIGAGPVGLSDAGAPEPTLGRANGVVVMAAVDAVRASANDGGHPITVVTEEWTC